MLKLRGQTAAWNYTIGPAFLFRGPEDIRTVYEANLPLVVCCRRLPLPDFARMDKRHVAGFVLEEVAGPLEVPLYWEEKRAAVTGVEGLLASVKPGMRVVVDGVEGLAILDPDPPTLEHYEELRRKGPPPAPAGMVQQIQEAMFGASKALASLDVEALAKTPEIEGTIRSALTLGDKIDRLEPLTEREREQAIALMSRGDAQQAEKARASLEAYDEAVKARSAEEKAGRERAQRSRRGDAAPERG